MNCVITGDIELVPLPSSLDQFDVLILSEVLEHLRILGLCCDDFACL